MTGGGVRLSPPHQRAPELPARPQGGEDFHGLVVTIDGRGGLVSQEQGNRVGSMRDP